MIEPMPTGKVERTAYVERNVSLLWGEVERLWRRLGSYVTPPGTGGGGGGIPGAATGTLLWAELAGTLVTGGTATADVLDFDETVLAEDVTVQDVRSMVPADKQVMSGEIVWVVVTFDAVGAIDRVIFRDCTCAQLEDM